MLFTRSTLCAAITALFAVLPAAHADNLSPGTVLPLSIDLSLTHSSQDPVNPSSQTQSYTSAGTYNLVSEGVTLALSPQITTSVSTQADFEVISTAHSSVVYYFEIAGPTTGPQAGALIPFVIQTSMSDSISVTSQPDNQENPSRQGYAYNAGASLTIEGSGIYQNASVDCTKSFYADPICSPSSYSGAFSGSIQAFTQIEVILAADASMDSTRVFGGPNSASATVDPIISFAPGFDSTGYSIIVSDGVSNGPSSSSAAPEPASLGLALLAAGAGTVFRRRRRVPYIVCIMGKKSGDT